MASASKRLSVIYEAFQTDFEPHLQATFERCAYVKTILNRASPVDLLSIYVNTRFQKNDETIDDYDLIESLHQSKRVCVMGRGGDGKTVFMKYLWLSIFNNPKGKVPIFIELRRINEFQSDDLLAYIYRSVIDVKSKISQSHFEAATHEGLFVFILDGFDEIVQEKKDSIEKQILSLSHSHPEAIVVVSGRFDSRYDAWQMFSNYRVLPLGRKQTIDLLNKLSYDRSTKKRFIERVKKDLYDKHKSFLSSPLLTTMMLLTFDQFADIPEKIYIFFDQAFDTLFLRHDATKEGFQRKKHTDLPIDRFKRYFSYFCMISYFDEKFELTETDIRTYSEKAFKVNDVSVDIECFIKDLSESICIMQREGLHYIFTHRSFQEYFAAFCLANFIDTRFGDICISLVGRPNDNVLSMLLDMQRDKMETNFIIPNLKRIIDKAKLMNCHEDVVSFIRHFNCSIRVMRVDDKDRIAVSRASKDHDFISLIFKLYPDYSFSKTDFNNYKELDKPVLAAVRSDYKLDHKLFNDISFWNGDFEKDNKTKRAKLSYESLKSSGYEKYTHDIFNKLERLQRKLVRRSNATVRNIDEILNLKPQQAH